MVSSEHHLEAERSAKPCSVCCRGGSLCVVSAQADQVARVQNDLPQLAPEDVGQGGQQRGLLGSRCWLRLQICCASSCVCWGSSLHSGA